jgi:hypothetical protein
VNSWKNGIQNRKSESGRIESGRKSDLDKYIYAKVEEVCWGKVSDWAIVV